MGSFPSSTRRGKNYIDEFASPKADALDEEKTQKEEHNDGAIDQISHPTAGQDKADEANPAVKPKDDVMVDLYNDWFSEIGISTVGS